MPLPVSSKTGGIGYDPFAFHKNRWNWFSSAFEETVGNNWAFPAFQDVLATIGPPLVSNQHA